MATEADCCCMGVIERPGSRCAGSTGGGVGGRGGGSGVSQPGLGGARSRWWMDSSSWGSTGRCWGSTGRCGTGMRTDADRLVPSPNRLANLSQVGLQVASGGFGHFPQWRTGSGFDLLRRRRPCPEPERPAAAAAAVKDVRERLRPVSSAVVGPTGNVSVAWSVVGRSPAGGGSRCGRRLLPRRSTTRTARRRPSRPRPAAEAREARS